ncbi:MAG: CHC2 zinc finger domain-containing protein [Acidobacteriota bacterium]|nr:CHC2 zinc finger domain-containing protein [Acidobacteriota bacterium]
MVVANSTVDYAELKARNPLGDAVEAAGVVLHGKGRVRQGVCPFHQEQEGSFTVYANTEKFWCFGCGAGGDVLDFVGRMEGLTLPEVIRRLDDGTTPPPRAPSRRPTPAQRPSSPALPPRDPALLTAAVRFYARQLRRSPAAVQYLAARGIGLDAAMRLGLGYAPGQGLRDHLQANGFTGQRQRDSGLFLERGTERFAGTITVPDLAQGLARWLTGRAVQPNARPRFQALPGSKPVLGLAALGPAPPWAIVAEGVFDWLALTAWDYPAVAALGTQGMDKVAAALRGCSRVFLSFDNDDAGNAAAAELKQLLGNRAAVVNLPHGVADLGELATQPNGQLLFRRLLARAARSAR